MLGRWEREWDMLGRATTFAEEESAEEEAAEDVEESFEDCFFWVEEDMVAMEETFGMWDTK
jgi:hypothetical protein